MGKDDADKSAILSRMRQELGTLPMGDREIERVALRIIQVNLLLREGMVNDPTSRIFNYAVKVSAVVEHFAADGLTLPSYVHAATKRPQLFCHSPATIIANIEAVTSHFAPDGLKAGQYLRAAIKQPSLWYQSPATVIANIERVVRHFAVHGLRVEDYLGAALKYPTLFSQSPKTVIYNIQRVCSHFRTSGLEVQDYLRAAIRQPPLFYQSPETIIRHVKLIISLQRQGFLTFPGEILACCSYSLKPMFNYLCKRPALFCLSDDNYTLRETYARLTGRLEISLSLACRQCYLLGHEYPCTEAISQ